MFRLGDDDIESPYQGFRQKKIMGGGTIRKHKFAKKGAEHFLEGLH